MSLVRSTGTKPELFIRSLLHRMGYRYRLHPTDLPGKPDIVFRQKKKVVFVHGCYWHRHDCKRGNRLPKTKQDFWLPKLSRNAERDIENQSKLASMGWDWHIVWECETAERLEETLATRLRNFLAD